LRIPADVKEKASVKINNITMKLRVLLPPPILQYYQI
jgi:hypothetical protein